MSYRVKIVTLIYMYGYWTFWQFSFYVNRPNNNWDIIHKSRRKICILTVLISYLSYLPPSSVLNYRLFGILWCNVKAAYWEDHLFKWPDNIIPLKLTSHTSMLYLMFWLYNCWILVISVKVGLPDSSCYWTVF